MDSDNTLIVDRIEGDIAVCEDSDLNMININIDDIVGNVKDGVVLVLHKSTYKVDEKLTLDRKNKIQELMKGMWE